MPANYKRTDRISEVIQRTLARAISQDIKDPRLKGLITVSAVKVASDLSHAKVYVTVFNDDKNLVLSILNGASSMLRSILAKDMTLRTVPKLHFVYDESIEYAKQLVSLIDKANESNSDDV